MTPFRPGPLSRRLGRSLGVDLVPPKTCTYDCIYCEVGPTTRLTLERLEWEADAILGEIDAYLEEAPLLPDFITLAGSGEPTLNAGIESLIAAVKERTQIPVAVLTNGALFFLPEVRRSLARADVVLPSLDAAREKTFRRINRPAPGLTLERLLSGLRDFRREFQVQVWLEVMLLKGLNDTEEELEALRREIARLHPDKVQLNTAVRPVVESFALALDREEMAAVAAFLGSAAEVIAHFERRPARPGALPVGMSVSGIAGPSGGTPDKPVGTTWIGLSVAEFDRAWSFQFGGDRLEVKQQAAEMALKLLVDYLRQKISNQTAPSLDG